MLVLTRRKDEEIVIGEDIRVRIISIAGNRTKIGITAPPGVRVLRTEVVDKEAAAHATGDGQH